jgi:hypothetical protein
VSGPPAEKPERAQLRLTDGHSYCPWPSIVLLNALKNDARNVLGGKKKPRSGLILEFTAFIPHLPPPTRKLIYEYACFLMAIA